MLLGDRQRLVWAGGAAAVLLTAAVLGGLAFYAPRKGVLAAGEELTVPDPAMQPRNRATVTVDQRLLTALGRRPTLRHLITFYALDDVTITCSVNERYGVASPPQTVSRQADRTLPPGDEVTLCLDPQ